MTDETLKTRGRHLALALGVSVAAALGGCTTEFVKTASTVCDGTRQVCPQSEDATQVGDGTDDDAGSGFTNQGPPPTKPHDAGTSSATASDAATAVAADGGTTGTGECGSNATQTACYACCNTNHPAGASFYQTAFLQCACSSPGTCATQCATESCNNVAPTSGDACDMCLSTASNGTCGSNAGGSCLGNADCVAWNACFTASACDTKK